ncbi:glycoside hydrolase family 15 protein [Rhizoctonia solani 123E]|uniref:glucan 1,4-alpha-glucosidase n=1 Tax=Rhizoctonia solani 123E TaxID=1423351 RepID=A0A074RQQ8_9AGAM|nr:glycoside hydrolase family 15 protein [Rhizoctonia solani 123E]
MRFSAVVLFASSALAASVPSWPTTGADLFQKSQYPISKAGILANIGSGGSKDQGAYKGVVIASPSKVDPDYVYTWIRDSALVYKVLVDQYVSGRDNSLLQGIYDWIASQTRLQQVANPSGTVDAGGLGEPKFNVNETEFTGSWGRPQRDGPALRATTFITFANDQLKKGKKSYVQSVWPAIKLDLDYVAQFWNAVCFNLVIWDCTHGEQSGYDLWEEVYGSSFFTLAASHRSLRQGAVLATKLGYGSLATRYTEQAVNVLCFLQSFWDSSNSHVISNLNSVNVRTGLDVNSILTSVHQFDPEAGCDVDTFQPCSDRALRNHKAVVDSFRTIYAINSNYSKAQGAAVGRYSEDVYYNGNPWYLATFAAAEQLYYATYQWLKLGKIQVTSLSLPFFQQIYPSAKVGTYSTVSKEGLAILLAVRKYADEFVLVNKQYVGPAGGLAEQFDRATGAPTSAVDLTWSYASAITAFDARSFIIPGSWGAKNLKAPSGTCKSQPIPKVAVTFKLVSESANAYVVGQLAELGVWDPAKAVQLQGSSPNWSVTIQLPISSTFEFKFIRKNADGVQWTSDPNLRYSTPANGTLVIEENMVSSESSPGTPSTMTSATSFSNEHSSGWNGADFPTLHDSATPVVNKSAGHTRSSSREDTPSAKKKWVPIPAAEMQAALDQARPLRSHSHSNSRTSSRRNSPGELRRGKRLPEEGYRRKSGLNTPTSKPATPSVPIPPMPPVKRKSPRASEPVTAVRPIPSASSMRFGAIDRPTSPPPDSDPHSHTDIHPKQHGRFGVSIGVSLAERVARRQAARCSNSTVNDIEDDWTGDGRWNFGLIGTFDRRAPLPRVTHQQTIHSPRARGARGRGMSRGYRGRGAYGYRGSPAEPDYAILPAPVDPYNPYAYGPWGYMPVPPMWMPYAPPPPPPPAIPSTGAPLPMPITQLPYPVDGLRYYVLGQVEYYFSIQNMCQDLYLRQQMDAQGWIPISTIGSFNRLRKLTTDIALVRETMQMSSIVEVSPDGEKARMAHGGWAQFVLPSAQAATDEGEPSMLGLVVGVEQDTQVP